MEKNYWEGYYKEQLDYANERNRLLRLGAKKELSEKLSEYIDSPSRLAKLAEVLRQADENAEYYSKNLCDAENTRLKAEREARKAKAEKEPF